MKRRRGIATYQPKIGPLLPFIPPVDGDSESSLLEPLNTAGEIPSCAEKVCVVAKAWPFPAPSLLPPSRTW